MKTEIPIDTLLKRLHLANARRVWRDLCARAEKEEWAYEHLLGVLFAEEVAHRQQTRFQKVSRAAGFPFLKTVDDFNFIYQSTVRLPLIGSYPSADFVTEGRSRILFGKPGRGKTHLAVALAYRAIQNGFDALFVTAAALIEELSFASRHGRLREAVAEYTHPHVLVIDEVGYLAYGNDAANVLYQVVDERHLKRRSMIFTTNKSLDAWGQVLHDKDLADAIVDRILERGRLLKLDGPSIRTKHLGLDDPTEEASTQPARMSGIRRPEFPEPTALFWIRLYGSLTELRDDIAGKEETLAAVLTEARPHATETGEARRVDGSSRTRTLWGMRLLPFERLTLRTDSSPEAVEAKLASLVATTWYSPSPPPEPFRGSVQGRHFKVVRVLETVRGLPTYNAWQPLIIGDIAPVAGGTRVRVRMRLRAPVGAFMAFWFGGLLWGAAMILRAGLLEGFGPSGHAAGAGVGLAFVGALMLAGHALMSVSFWAEVKRALRALSEGLGCPEAEPVNRLVRR